MGLRWGAIRGGLRLLAGSTAFFMAIAQPAMAADALKGVALVIGQSDYEAIKDLPNTERDADAVEKLLGDLGFDATATIDRDAKRLSRDLDAFLDDAKDADVAVFYYAGHAVEVGGENFLVATDAGRSSDALAQKLVSLTDFVGKLSTRAKITIILLDACRNNPFPAGTVLKMSPDDPGRPIGVAGLGETRSVEAKQKSDKGDDSLGVVIAFAAAPGKTAKDGKPGGNSPYATALLRHLSAMAGEEFGTVMRMVAEEVYLKTEGEQRPWINESLRRLLYLGEAPEPVGGDEGDILTQRRQLLVTIASLPDLQRKQVETAAAQGGVPMDALYALLKAMGADTPKDPKELQKLLLRQAGELKDLLSRRDAMENSDDEIRRLSRLTDEAVADGAIEKAKALRGAVDLRIASLSTTLDDAEAKIKQRRIEFASEFARSAKVNELAYDFQAAADYYRKAYEQVKGRDEGLSFKYLMAEGQTLTELGRVRGTPGSLEKAIETLAEAEATRSREASPADWASARLSHANAIFEKGEADATPAGVASLALARDMYVELTDTVWTRAKDPRNWAATNINIADALETLGARSGDDRLYAEALTHYRAALEVYDRKTFPLDWSDAKANIGSLLWKQAESQGPALLDQADAELRAALEERNREKYPADWARLQANLGLILIDKGKAGADIATLNRAIEALQLALSETQRENAPLNWATIQNALGNAYSNLYDLEEDAETLRLSEEAYQLALQESTRSASPLDWATTNYNLANILDQRGRLTKDAAYFRQSIARYRAALEELDAAGATTYHARAMQMLTNPTGALFELEPTLENAKLTLAVNQDLLALFPKDANPPGWARYANNTGYYMVEVARLGGDSALLPQAVSMLRDTVAIREVSGDDPSATANAAGNLCYALVENAASSKDAAIAKDAVVSCDRALAMDDNADVRGLVARARSLAGG